MRQLTQLLKSAARVDALMFLIFMLTGPAALDARCQERPVRVPENPARQQAWLALEEIASESKGYEDHSLRARVRAQVADIMWPADAARARDFITAAFEDAAAIKGDLPQRYDARAQVMAVARRHDPEFAAKLIARLTGDGEGSRERLSRDSLEQISERGALYLDSARDSLRRGDQSAALSFARRSFAEGHSAQFIWFLNELRARDKAAADQFFLDALGALRRGPADPNDVLLLGLYLFYPGGAAAGTLRDGVEAVSYGITFTAAPPAPQSLARPYLQAAADVLLRFQVVPGQPGPAGSVELKRFALLQLLPLFQRYEPQRVADIAGALTALGPHTPPPAGAANEPLVLDENASAGDMIENIERLSNPKERDHYFFAAVKAAVGRGDYEKARALAARIGESELKQLSLEWASFNEARTAMKRGELDEAARIASARLSRERRTIIHYELASAWLARGDFASANREVNAAAEAIKTADREGRARVHIYLAAGLAERDPLRAFQYVEAAVEDINAIGQFDVADDRITLEIKTPLSTHSFVLSQGVGLLSAVSHLTRFDLNRALNVARAIRPAGPRALTVLAACRAALNKGN